MNEADVDYLIEQVQIKNPEFIDISLNEQGLFKEQKAAMLLDSVLEMLLEICGEDMPASLDMRNQLKKVYYHAKLSIAQNQNNRLKRLSQ